MKLLHIFFLLLLSPVCTAYSMEDMTALANALPNTDKDFGTGPLYITSFKPDLMPQAGKDLIERLKNPNKGKQPDYIFFHGPQGCGKSTLIDQLTASIGADHVYTHYSELMSHCKSENVTSSSVIQKLANLACQRAKDIKCPYAVIVFDDFDDLYKDHSDRAQSLRHALFNSTSTFDCGNLHLLVLAESYSGIRGTTTENIRVSYPTIDQYKQLGTYFAKQFKLNLGQTNLDSYYSKPISDLRKAVCKAAMNDYAIKKRDKK